MADTTGGAKLRKISLSHSEHVQDIFIQFDTFSSPKQWLSLKKSKLGSLLVRTAIIWIEGRAFDI